MTVDASVSKLRIAIVGGGPGGLATAIALSRIPHVEVRIYEQAHELREVGAGISIGSNSWKVLELLGVADTLTSGHPTWTVLNMNGRSGEELHRRQKSSQEGRRAPIRTQRTKLQSTLLSHVREGIIQLSKRLVHLEDLGDDGVKLIFGDGTSATADLVVGADGIRSVTTPHVVRDKVWPNYELKFTGTTIWRALVPWNIVQDLDSRFKTTAWWHEPTTHVFFSPVGEGLWEIAARAWHDPATHSASKVSWGVPVANEYVESHFRGYLPDIQVALSRVPTGLWREFAAFAGPEMKSLSNWNKIVLVGDSSHALSGAFGSGAGFAMEDGWILAKSLERFGTELSPALALFNAIRLPYYSRMYRHLAEEAARRATRLEALMAPTFDQRIRNKIIVDGGTDMSWIYENNIEATWKQAVSGQHKSMKH
ncbi:putative monooxygenase [Pyrenochaeta sp. DS3sAY3a]|nr:putative monooxygenase [Pyrenochaeta sp. DS3sAY3a]